ncbi:MAG: SdrD B-like domain-containing protein [Phaeodactylibacter sp.]|uniref:DUF7507 domain-containing protein n=1 Tax=Phaeodactylibacter sp. TaxID=1940289 RepID=UPI0032ECF076
MRHSYTNFNVVKRLTEVINKALLVLLLGAISFSVNAQNPCSLSIDEVVVDCAFQGGSSTFDVTVSFSWEGVAGNELEIIVAGQSQTYAVNTSSGSGELNGFTLPAPGAGYPVMLTAGATCQVLEEVAAVACTPPCAGDPDEIGGLVWEDLNYDGALGAEPGLANIKVEAYDCNNELAGSAYSNADGVWSIPGLTAGEDYRIELTAQNLQGVGFSMVGEDNVSNVRFAQPGTCTIMAGFVPQIIDEDCENPDNYGNACIENFNILDWADYANGTNPFLLPPYTKVIDGDEISWSVTSADATPLTHRVYHEVLGGDEEFYSLEMDADSHDANDPRDVGVVFSFDRPVQRLIFKVLDIDITGNAIDRVAIQGSLGGVPVSMDMEDSFVGVHVNQLGDGVFEGTTTVNDASTSGNVTVHFTDPVDQVAINFSAIGAAVDDPGLQMIGLGKIQWCEDPVPIAPQCARIMDWHQFGDNNANPMPIAMAGAVLDVINEDPAGIATNTAFMVDTDLSPLGGTRGFWPLGMDAGSVGQYVQSSFTFGIPVDDLSFSILGIDQMAGAYQDKVSVHGFYNGTEVALSLNDVMSYSGMYNNQVALLSPNEYESQGVMLNASDPSGNVWVHFSEKVDSVVVRLEAGAQSPGNPSAQMVGVSDFTFCICRPAPIQLGDYVWGDKNKNGIQDACETPLAGMPISLYDGSGNLLAATTSAADGHYHFTKHGTTGENWLLETQVLPQTQYYIVFGDDSNNPENQFVVANGRIFEATGKLGGSSLHDSNPDPEALSANMPGSIPDGLPYFLFSTGEAGYMNASLDAGFQEVLFDLSLKKELDTVLTPPPFIPGQLVKYNITVYNEGMLSTTFLRVVDYAPAGLNLEDGGDYHVTGNLFELPDLEPGDSVSMSVTYRIDNAFTGETLVNAAEIAQVNNAMGYSDTDSTPDFINGNDNGEDDYSTASITVNAALIFDLSLEKKVLGNGPFEPGQDVTFEISVKNEGILLAEDVVIQDYTPQGLILSDADWENDNGVAVLKEAITEIETGQTATVQVTFTIDPFFTGSSIINTAEVFSFYNFPWTDDQDSSPNNNNPEEDDQDEVLVMVQPSFDLALHKNLVSFGPYEPGDLVTFEFEVTNQGSVMATSVQINEQIPEGLVLEDADWEMVTAARANLIAPIPLVMPGATETVEITFRIENGFSGVSIINYGEIGTYDDMSLNPDADSTPGNGSTQEDDDDTAVVTVQQPMPVFDLSLTKQVNEEVNPGPFLPGQTVAFDITVTNEGNLTASGVQIVDYIPNFLTLTSNAWMPIMNSATLMQPIASIAPGESVTRTITFMIDGNAPEGAIVNNAEVAAASNVLGMADTDSTPFNGINGEDDSDNAAIEISPEFENFDLELDKSVNASVTPGPYEPGDAITFTITVDNNGTLAAENVQIEDTYPASLIPNDPNWTFDNGTATLNTPIANIPVDGSVSVNITFTINTGFTGTTINNIAEIFSVSNASQLPDDDSTPNNGVSAEDDQDNALISVVQNYDLALTKTIETPGPYVAGQYVTYHLNVSNQGNITGTDIQLYDYYPFSHLTLADSDWEPVQGNILRLKTPIASLAPGASVSVPITFQIKANVDCGEVLTNCAEIAGDSTPQPDVDSYPADGSHDQDDDDAIDITVSCVQNFDLALEKTVLGSSNLSPGSPVTFRIAVTNEGGLTAQNIEIVDYVPQGLVVIDPDWTNSGGIASLNTNIASLAPGATVTVDIDMAVIASFAGATITNYAEIAGATNSGGVQDSDSTPGNGANAPNEDDYDGAIISLQQQTFDLALSKSLNSVATPGPFEPGDEVSFNISITNQGSVTAQNIQLREYIPGGLTLIDPAWNAVGSVAELNVPLTSITPGATTTISVAFEINSNFTGTSLTNFAEVGSAFNTLGIDDQDSTPGNGSMGPGEDDYDGATISVLQQNFDLALSKSLNTSATPGPFMPGSPVTFTITVTNQGSMTAQTIQLRDYVPLGLVLADTDWNLNGSTAIFNNAITNLAPGQSASVDISFTVSTAFTGSVINNNAEIGAFTNDLGIGDSDSTPANGAAGSGEDDYDNAIITILDDVQEFDLALTKNVNTSITPGPFLPGSTVTFSITVTNEGDINAQNVQVRDYIPLGLQLADNTWSQNGSFAELSTPIASLPAGASATRNITFTVSPSFTGIGITNYAEISAASNTSGFTDVDSTPGNASAGSGEDDFDGAFINVSQEDDPVFDLSLEKAIDTDATPGPYQPGNLVTFVITVTNEGDLTAQNIVLKDYVPAGLIPADINWSPQGGTVVLNTPIATLAPGNSASVTVDFVVNQNFQGSSVVNYAEIHSATNAQGIQDIDSTPNNGFAGSAEDDIDSATLTVTQQDFDLALIKTVATVGPFEPGDNVTFNINISNQGSIGAQFVEVQDFIPDGLTLIDPDWTENNGIATLNQPIFSLSAGQTTMVTIDFVIDPEFDGVSIENFAEILSAVNPIGLGDGDSTPGNGAAGGNEDDYSSAALIVDQTPEAAFDLALTKVVSSAGPYTMGGAVTYSITITNQGDFPAYNVEITDYIPTGLNLTDTDWSQVGSQARYTIPGPIAALGGTETVTIDFEIDAGYMGSAITNYAEISAADDDNDPTNTPPTDVDSFYDYIPSNDAGGAPNTAADNAINGNGTGAPGSGIAATDEDDHDPATITLNNCDNLSAGIGTYQQLCLSCTPDEINYDLFGALAGTPSPGGFWQDLDGAGVSLIDPANVDFAGVPEGSYDFVYTVGGMGVCPQTSATVTIEITDITSYGCNDQVNVTFGTSCEILVTPDMILEGTPDCMGSLQVNLINENGVPIGNTITGNEVGQLLIAEVIDPYCGLLCWGNVWVTDVTAPTIVCPTQEIDLICSDFDFVMDAASSLQDLGQPTVLDNCVDYNTITFTDEMVMGLPDCEGQRINRTFTVTDPAGNSTTCVQEINFRNLSFSDIMQPDPAPVVSCDQPFDADPVTGNPTADVTGSPMIDGYYNDYFFNGALCDLGAVFEDGPPVQVCDGTIKFVREWTIIDWCPGGGANTTTFNQLIKVGDDEGPSVTPPNVDSNGDGDLDPLIYSTGTFDCTAAIVVPEPDVVDNCSSFEIDTDILVEEIVPDYNQFGQLIGYDTVQTVFASIGPNDSRFITGIPIGCHTFRYKVTDDCNNFTITDAPFCIEDNIEPVAVCDDDLNISLGGNGAARVFATDIDEGSSDNCGIASLEVRRLYEYDPNDCNDVADYYSDWGNFVDFSCCDAGSMVTIELRVTDIYGNQNICWLEVMIEDKINPFCVAPDNTTISCADIPTGFDPEDPQALDVLFGIPGAQDDCGVASVQEFTPESTLDACGFGTIIRTFTAFDNAGNQSTNTCQQIITVTEEYDYTIKFPKDEISNCGVPSPDTILVNGQGCDMLSVSVVDEYFYPNAGGNDASCYKIFRRYRVQNMCEWDGISGPFVVGRNEDCDGTPGDEDVWVVRTPGISYLDRDNNPNNSNPAFGVKGTSCDGQTNPAGYWRTVSSVGYWEYTQIIEVSDTEAPEISFSGPQEYCSINQVTCNATVQFPFTIVENCDPSNLNITVQLDAGADGTVDFNITNQLSGSYPNYVIGGEYPIGTHEFRVTVSDGCGGNTDFAVLPFEVIDCAPPTLTCLNGITFSLQELPPNTDIDGDGEIDAYGAGIWANDFHISESDCSDDTIAFSINLVGETPNFNQTSIYFTCDDVGNIPIEVYFYDSAFNPNAVQPDGSVGGPNWDFCETYVLITDPEGFCTTTQADPMMAGLISRENDDAVEAVEVSLSGQMSSSMMTTSNGTYEFADLPMGYDYTVTPLRNDEHRNGISTFDLIIIQQHLLGIASLSSPYKRIAADVNRTNSITTLDMIQIQKLILGEIQEFNNNTSWRFVDRNFVFPVPTNPWFSLFPESISINDLDDDVMANDFVAIKVGDVNNSATTTLFTGIDERSFRGALQLETAEQPLQKGTQVRVPVSAPSDEPVYGYQFSMNFDTEVLELSGVEYGLAQENSLGLYDAANGLITASWYDEELMADGGTTGGPVLFTLVFDVVGAQVPTLSKALEVNSSVTLAEAYSRDGRLLDVDLNFVQGDVAQAPFRLYQNRPNPFQRGTVIGFDLPEAGTAVLHIFDLNGRLLKTYEGDYAAGYNEVQLQRDELPATGVFYYRLQMNGQVATRKMIVQD